MAIDTNLYKIPESTFNELVTEAGLLLSDFDIEAAATDMSTAFDDEDIICATTGGITVTATPTFSDMGEDIDNCPVNMLELKNLDSWECSIAGTALTVSVDALQRFLGVADVNGDHVTLRNSLNTSDFRAIWWVGPLSDGGFAAAKLSNALSTQGLSLQTSKNGKATTGFTLTGHYSINAQDTVPLELWVKNGSGGLTSGILFDKHSATIKVGDTVKINVVDLEPDDATVTWASGTTAKATISGGTAAGVTVTGVAEGSSIITGAITVDGVTYNDTCTVVVEAAE